jgi:UDP-N-acetylglucosamine--N-acetylmuramyl-(pentapeptide) pyrophosphoryl-undecaprenol N-acetylglucosamine transferase
VIWQTGKAYYARNVVAAKSYEEKIKVKEFIDRMDLAYAAADVVISRAGALSIAELCIAEKPCVLVPSPNVAEDHQSKNAMALVNKDAALLVKDSEANEKLIPVTLQLMKEEALQQKLKRNIAQLARPDADDAIANEVLKLIKE